MGLEKIEHVVVVMMENRSFDNLLGWLYQDSGNKPPFNIPDQNPTTFDGLVAHTFSNRLGDQTVYASNPPTVWPPSTIRNVVPTPDPHEEFDHIATQLYGTYPPPAGMAPNMSGFLADYATTEAGLDTAAQIMQSFGPAEANVINSLARQFAVSDRWFASVPAQTWPNRGFVHTGSSDGHINNDDYEFYDIPTIFNVLQTSNLSWLVFADTTLIPSLTHGQFFPRLYQFPTKFKAISNFNHLCSASETAPPDQKLPAYSFIEPRFVPEIGLLKINYPNDYHPPHDVSRGDKFLADIYEAVRSSPYRDKILLVITFDEHGGCYDHVPPPNGAAAPQPYPVSRDGQFDFSRFGVRVPAIVISSYVKPGTVFRSNEGEPPFDHTSILATLRDRFGLGGANFLPSPRIQNAPTLNRVLTQTEENKISDWPAIYSPVSIITNDVSLSTPLNDVQKSLIASALRMQSVHNAFPTSMTSLSASTVREAWHATAPNATAIAKGLTTYRDALKFLHPDIN